MPVQKRQSTSARCAARLARELGISADYARTRGLRRQREANPRTLVDLGRAADDGQRVRLSPRAASAWSRMRAAAARDDIILLPLSGYRSLHRQARIFRRKLRAGGSLAEVLRFVAAPGYSEHHTGRALDIGSPEHLALDEDFARTAAFRWLKMHAGHFGFYLSYPKSSSTGIAYEPWHWCWRA